MRKIKEALRMKAAGLSTRQIAASLSVGQSAVYGCKLNMSHVNWILASNRSALSNEAVEDVAKVLHALPRGHPSLNMRTPLSRLLDDRAELERQPLLN